MLPDLPHLTRRTLRNRTLRLAGSRTTLYSVAEFLKLVWEGDTRVSLARARSLFRPLLPNACYADYLYW